MGLKSAAPGADILPLWQAQALPWIPIYIVSAFSEDLHAVSPSPFLGSGPNVPASAPSPDSPWQPRNRSSAGNLKFTQRLMPHSNSCVSNATQIHRLRVRCQVWMAELLKICKHYFENHNTKNNFFETLLPDI